MTFRNDTSSKTNTAAVALPDIACTRCLSGRHHSQRTRGLLMCILATAMVSLMLAAVGTYPAFSQGVQLVKVDVQVVASGYRVSKLTGHAVVNDKNERIGKIDDFVIGRNEGHSLFTVLQVGGFLGIGSRLVAVPYDSLIIDQTGNKIELPGASKDQLERLTKFRYGT